MAISKILVGERQFTLDWLLQNPEAAHQIYDKAAKESQPVRCLCNREPVPMIIVANAYLRTRNGWRARHAPACPFYKPASRPSAPSAAPASATPAMPDVNAPDFLDVTLNQLLLLSELHIWSPKFSGKRRAHTVLDRFSEAAHKLAAGGHSARVLVLTQAQDRRRMEEQAEGPAKTSLLSLGLVDRCSQAKKGHVLRLAYEGQALWLPPSLDEPAAALAAATVAERGVALVRWRPAGHEGGMPVADGMAVRYFGADWRLAG